MRPLIVDYCCGAGLASDGYFTAGIDVRGVDLYPQPDYPYELDRGDVLEALVLDHTDDIDGAHFSPPCQLFTRARHLREAQGSSSKESIDYLSPTIALLRALPKWQRIPWVVENVPSRETRAIMAPGVGEHLTTLCGSMFGLEVQRHRLFLTNFPLTQPRCDHSTFPIDPASGKPRPWGVYHVPADEVPSGGRTARNVEHGRHVMGVERDVPWSSLKEGLPPKYTEHVGRELARHLDALERAA